jgi:hypothetical protein
MPRSRLCVVKAVDHAHAFHRLLRHAVEHRGRLHAHGLEGGRIDIDHAAELGPNTAFILDARGPGNHETVACSAEMRRHLLGPLERRVHGVGPAYRIVVECRGAAQVVHMRHHLLEVFGNAVENRHLVKQTLQRSLGAGAIVALDVDDQRVIQLSHVIYRLVDAAHLRVAVR